MTRLEIIHLLETELRQLREENERLRDEIMLMGRDVDIMSEMVTECSAMQE